MGWRCIPLSQTVLAARSNSCTTPLPSGNHSYWPAQEAQGGRRQSKQQVKVCKSETKKEPLCGELATLETQIKACKTAVTSANSAQITTMMSIFSTVTFFSGDGKIQWKKIVTKQTNNDKWADLCGLKHKDPCSKTIATFKDSMMLFLKTVFANNASEDMKFSMTCLKKINRVKVRSFYSKRRC